MCNLIFKVYARERKTVIKLSENLCKHGKGEELVEVFQLLSMNLDSYNVMVSYLCKVGRVKEAYQVLQEMKKKGLGPDVSSYNYLLEACCALQNGCGMRCLQLVVVVIWKVSISLSTNFVK